MNKTSAYFKISLMATAASLCLAFAATAQAPAAPSGGPGSLHGIWNNPTFTTVRNDRPEATRPPLVLRDPDGNPVGILPWAVKVADDRRAVANQIDVAVASCTPLGGPFGMPQATGIGMEWPMQIIETPAQKQITILYENYTTFRTIKMDQPHDANSKPSAMGDAVGHWDGDTLVVDTVSVSLDTHIPDFYPHTDKLHIVERLRRTSPTTMEDKVVIDDPGAFTKPIGQLRTFKMIPGMRLGEFVCASNLESAEGSVHPGF